MTGRKYRKSNVVNILLRFAMAVSESGTRHGRYSGRARELYTPEDIAGR